MNVTVAICTWNRCRLLDLTLASLNRVRTESIDNWQILLVDNGSQDATSSVVKSHASKLPLRYLRQPVQGHARSRNFAIQHATGDLMIWTDDDVQVDPGWLAAYVSAAHRHPQATFFGGPIEPQFEGARPEWLAETWTKCRAAFAARDQGAKELTIPPALFPFGANFAVRMNTQKEFLFDTSLGRSARSMLGEDEIDLLQRLVEAGHQGVWLPLAQLRHLIPAERATPEYVGRYFVGQGMANVIKNRPTLDSRFHALRVAVLNRLCYWLKKNRKSADEWVSHLIRSSIAWGEFRSWNSPIRRTPTSTDLENQPT